MESYANKNGDSPIVAYQINETCIKVAFREADEIYTYSHQKAGKNHVEEMKKLARNGFGLATYINQNTRHLND